MRVRLLTSVSGPRFSWPAAAVIEFADSAEGAKWADGSRGVEAADGDMTTHHHPPKGGGRVATKPTAPRTTSNEPAGDPNATEPEPVTEAPEAEVTKPKAKAKAKPKAKPRRGK